MWQKQNLESKATHSVPREGFTAEYMQKRGGRRVQFQIASGLTAVVVEVPPSGRLVRRLPSPPVCS